MLVTEQYQALWDRLHALREPWLELRLTAREDQPEGGGDQRAEAFADRVDDALAALDEAIAAMSGLSGERRSLGTSGDTLARVGDRLADVAKLYWRELAAFEPQVRLRRLANERGREWQAWVSGLRAAMAPLPDRLEAAEAGVRAASRELLDRAAWAIDHADPEGR